MGSVTLVSGGAPVWAQALEEERLGPRREPYSDERNMRLAVQEGATALACSLLPAIEPVVLARPPPPVPYSSIIFCFARLECLKSP